MANEHSFANMKPIATPIKDAGLVKRRRSEICEAAYRVFVSKGFHGATMRQVASAAGVGIGSLYDYIRKKEDLLDLIYEKTMAEALELMRAAIAGIDDAEKRMRALLRVNLEMMHQHQDFFLLMYQESKSMSKTSLQHVLAKEREYVSIYRDTLAKGIEQGVFRVSHVEFTAIAIAFLCSVWALKRWNLKGQTLQDAIDSIADIVLRGVKANGGTGGA